MREALITRRGIASAIPLAALAAAPDAARPAPATASDAVLLDLGRQWEAIQNRFEARQPIIDGMSAADFALTGRGLEAEQDKLFAEASAIFDTIMATPARTMEGLAVKARILAHEHDCVERDEAAIERALQDAWELTNVAAFSIALDIVRLARSAA